MFLYGVQEITFFMENGPAITEENLVTKLVLERIVDTGTGKLRPYRPPLLCAGAFQGQTI
jgi:hypothetical protein